MPLWLARHALPLIASGTCYGALDVAADEAATRQAAQALADVLPQGMAMAWSPLRRCAQLASALALLRPDLASRADPRLREMDFGTWEGRPWEAIGRQALKAWTDDFASYRPGGGENLQAFMQRVAEAWDEVGLTPCVWITHAGVIRAASLLAAGRRHIERADQWPTEAPAYGSFTCIAREACVRALTS